MHTAAGRIGVSVVACIACFCVVVACGQTPPATPPQAVGAVSETATPPLQVTVQAAETANAAAFTAEAQAQPRLDLTRVTLPPPSPPPPVMIPSTRLSLLTQTPIPLSPTVTPIPAPVPGVSPVAYPLIRVDDLIQQSERYDNVRFSVIGYVYHVHTRAHAMTFFLASDAHRSNSIFVSLESVDDGVRENAVIQVYGTGAKTIRVLTDGNVESATPFMHALVVRPVR